MRSNSTSQKVKSAFVERRRYIRLKPLLSITYILPSSATVRKAMIKDVSADGLRFETFDPDLKVSSILEIKLDIPNAANPAHAKGRVVWQKKVTLEDGAPVDCGIELVEIEEDNKNTFLKFLCDLIYDIDRKAA